MAIFTNENASAWQSLFDSVSKDRPSVGKRVRVAKGRKHLGIEGVVVWHGVNRYANTRYLSDAQQAMRDAMGTFGYRVGIQPDDGTEKFYVDADKVEIIGGQHGKVE